MPEFNDGILNKFIKKNEEDAQVLVLLRLHLTNVSLSESIELSSCSYLNLSFNDLQDIYNLWQYFPELWWINLSHNSLPSLKNSFVSMPSAFGLLDLSYNNDLTIDDIIGLHSIQILRLKLPKTILESTQNDITEKETRKELLSYLPYIWTLNDDFITVQEKEKIIYKSEDMFIKSNEWETKSLGNRVGRFLHICQVFPTSGPLADTIRLDILLEDYLELARVNNVHTHLSKSSFKRMPSVDLIAIMSIPHRVRIDLSVLLTTSILFDLPQALFNDAIILLLNGHMNLTDIQDIPYLPLFARTALVNIIRRICFREIKEVEELGFNLPKLLHSDYPDCIFKTKKDPMLPTFLDTSGFNHLRPLKIFLNRPIEFSFTTSNNATNIQKAIEFSDLEIELLKYLPDCPTKFNIPDVNTTDYRSWVSLSCRHSVLLLVKCPLCPTLTRGQNNKVSQDLYKELLPVLTAAGMIYSDLELETTGPLVDGRLAPVTNKLTKEMSNAMIGGHVLSFGEGLPTGVCENLSWNDPSYKRPYPNLSTWEEYSQVQSKSIVQSPGNVASEYDNNVQNQNKSFFSDEIDLNSDGVFSNMPLSDNNKVMSSRINTRGSGLIQTINDSKPASPLQSRPSSPVHFKSGQVISPNGLTQGKEQIPDLVRPLHSQPNSNLQKDSQHYWHNQDPKVNNSNQQYDQIEKKHFLKSYTDTGIYKNNKLEIKPVAMNSVGIFSADCNWESSFLVAPKLAIEDHNMRLQDKFQHWDVIEKAPVMIHPLGGGDVDVSESKLLSLTGQFSDDVPDNSRMVSKNKPIMSDTITDNNISLLSETNNISLISETINAIIPKLEIEPSQTIQISNPNSMRLDKNKKVKVKFQSKISETVPDATRRLLAEMGTLRNMREINKHKNRETFTNEILEEVEIQKIPKQIEVGSRPQSNGSRPLSHIGDADKGKLINPFDSSKLSASRSKAVFGVPEYGDSYPMDKPDYKKIEKEKEDTVFLTGVNISETEEIEESTINEPSIINPSLVASCPGISVVTMQQALEQAVIEPTYTLTAKEVLSLKLNYDKLYTNTQGIEYAYTTKGGAAISNIKYFYPVNEKIIYTLDKNSVNHEIHNQPALPSKQKVKNIVNLQLNNKSVISAPTCQNASRKNSPYSKEVSTVIPNISTVSNVDNGDNPCDENPATKLNQQCYDADDDDDNNNIRNGLIPSNRSVGDLSIGSLSSGGSSATRNKKTNKAIDELVKELNGDSFVSKKKNDNYLKFISKKAFDGYDNNGSMEKSLETNIGTNPYFGSQITDSRLLEERDSYNVEERKGIDGYSIITSPQIHAANFNTTSPPSPSCRNNIQNELSYDVNRRPPTYMETTVKKVYTLDPFSTNGEDIYHNNPIDKSNFNNMTDELSSCGRSVELDSIPTNQAMNEIDHLFINNKSNKMLKQNNPMTKSLPLLYKESITPKAVNVYNVGLQQYGMKSVSSVHSPQRFLIV
jgi:hypothetical protein